MRSVRLVTLTLLLAPSSVVSARSENTPEKRAVRRNLLGGCLKVGEHVELGTSSNGAYHIRVVAPDELDTIRQVTKDYPAILQQHASKYKELAEARCIARSAPCSRGLVITDLAESALPPQKSEPPCRMTKSL